MKTLAGQALVETLLVMMLVSLFFFGLFQLCLVFAARDMLDHAAQRSARARTVGFNRWMVTKVKRVAVIPNAGALLEPPRDVWRDPMLSHAIRDHHPGRLWDLALQTRPTSAKGRAERARIPEYLASHHPAPARQILEYADWDRFSRDEQWSGFDGGRILDLQVRQTFPLRVPLAAYFVPDRRGPDGVPWAHLSGRAGIEAHFPHFLDDQDW